MRERSGVHDRPESMFTFSGICKPRTEADMGPGKQLADREGAKAFGAIKVRSLVLKTLL